MRDGFARTGQGWDSVLAYWEVGVRGPAVLISITPATSLCFADDTALGPFAEAVTAALQLSGPPATAPTEGTTP